MLNCFALICDNMQPTTTPLIAFQWDRLLFFFCGRSKYIPRSPEEANTYQDLLVTYLLVVAMVEKLTSIR